MLTTGAAVGNALGVDEGALLRVGLLLGKLVGDRLKDGELLGGVVGTALGELDGNQMG
jgi:hypothetical protein